MKQTIEIEVPDGKKAVWKDGKIVFEDVRPNLPKTWEEFCKQNRIKGGESYIGIDSEIEISDCGCRLKEADKNLLPNIDAAQSHLALMQLHQLRDCYRQGWVPNWNNNRQYKYVIYICKGQIICDVKVTISRFLAFQSKELAEEFLRNFKELIEQTKDLI